MKATRPDLAFERLLTALERDLLDATEDEILAAARELGMNPAMKGSAALSGVTLHVGPLAGTLSRSTLENVRLQKATRVRRRSKGTAPKST